MDFWTFWSSSALTTIRPCLICIVVNMNANVTFWGAVVRGLIHDLATLDPVIGRLDPRDCIFRINRDIRFSADKSPYKTQFGAFIAPGGKQSGNAGYYIHLEPRGNSFIAGGVYLPPVPVLMNIRSYIDEHGRELRAILSDQEFRK